MFKKKSIGPALDKIYSPQDIIKEQSEREKKIALEIYKKVEEEFYENANLSRLFEDPMMETSMLKYAPVASLIASAITLIVVIAK